MIPATFDYHRANTLAEAFAFFKEYGKASKYMSGGHSLLPMMKLRFATPEHIIDIGKIEGMSYVREERGTLKIGALTTDSQIEDDSLLQEKYPVFADVSRLIADPSVRNFATIGGNIAHGDAANDQPAVMIALRANLIVQNPKGKSRTIAIDDFFKGFYNTALEAGEILTEIQIPATQANSSAAYHKIERKVGDYATAGVAVALTMDKNGKCEQAGLGLTNLSSVPIRVSRAEEFLQGKQLTENVMAEAADICAQDCKPNADLRGSVEYKRALTKELTIRQIKRVLQRIGA